MERNPLDLKAITFNGRQPLGNDPLVPNQSSGLARGAVPRQECQDTLRAAPAHISHTGEARRRGQGSALLGNKPISRIPNLSIVPSAHCTAERSSILNIVSDLMVLLETGPSSDINCLTPPGPHMVKLVRGLLVLLHRADLQLIGHLLLSPLWFYYSRGEPKTYTRSRSYRRHY